MASRVVNMIVPEDLLRQVDEVARSAGFSRSELFRQAARQFVDAQSPRRKSAQPVLSRLMAISKKGPNLSASDLDETLYRRKRR
jgi:metal-responsive CopG/Arc/MetJ family transcriptional regulator